jgi:uncharacterized protein
MVRDDQTDVIAFLSNPASYLACPDTIERFETHGALVFLAGDDAWKIKRAVRFPYMDFSTLDKRRAVCAREIVINRRLAPDLYLGCVPITRRSDGGLEFGGAGEVAEWAVHMRRFDQADLLKTLALKGEIGKTLAIELADAVVDSHRKACVTSNAQGGQRVRAIETALFGTIANMQASFQPGQVATYGELITRQDERAAWVIDARAAGGHLRRCHGDLHLGNIVLWQGRPVLFDALEFDEDLATIDTHYDLAFLLMDLDQSGQQAAANVVLNRYLWRSDGPLELDGLLALPLYLGLRAGIRAMVMAQRADQSPFDRRDNDLLGAQAYLNAANRYLMPAPPQLIAVGGLSGTGKSTLAAALAPTIGATPGAVHLRSDLERKSLAGVAETHRLGAEMYTQAASDKVYRIMQDKARRALSAGHSVIVDAVYGTSGERREIEDVAAQLGVAFHGLWLTAYPDQMIARVAARRGDASDATPDIVRGQIARGLGGDMQGWANVDATSGPAQSLRNAQVLLGAPLHSV